MVVQLETLARFAHLYKKTSHTVEYAITNEYRGEINENLN
jgi:hypothetical protein